MRARALYLLLVAVLMAAGAQTQPATPHATEEVLQRPSAEPLYRGYPPPDLWLTANGGTDVEAWQGLPLLAVLDVRIEEGQWLTLQSPDGPWTDLLRFEITDAQGQAVAATFSVVTPPVPKVELRRGRAQAAWVLSGQQTARLAPGDYTITCAVEGGAREAPYYWAEEATAPPVRLRLAVAPAALTADQEREQDLLRVDIALFGGDASGALQIVDAIVARDKNDPQAHATRGDVLNVLKRGAQAAEAYRQAAALVQAQRSDDMYGVVALLRRADTAMLSGSAEPPPTADNPATPATGPTVPTTAPASAVAGSVNSLDPGLQRQWAARAVASSEYSTTRYSAMQTTGGPNTARYGDAPTAWTPPSDKTGIEWLELTYAFPFVPVAIEVYESCGAGAITKVLLRPEGEGAEWITVLQQTATGGHDKDTAPFVTRIALEDMTQPARAVRVEIDTKLPGWNEIDAVALVGRYVVGPPGTGLSTGQFRWWAEGAAASSQYGEKDYSATQATGAPNTPAAGDFPTAWAPKGAEVDMQWLEVSYPAPLVATELHVHETSAPGFVTKLEAWDEQGTQWVTLWEGEDPTKEAPGIFSPPLAKSPAAKRYRIHVNTKVRGWNEIDAVELVGNSPP